MKNTNLYSQILCLSAPLVVDAVELNTAESRVEIHVGTALKFGRRAKHAVGSWLLYPLSAKMLSSALTSTSSRTATNSSVSDRFANAVSKLMRHSSIHMTANQYYHLLDDEKRRTIMKLPSLSGPVA